jgi:hypothetical protein
LDDTEKRRHVRSRCSGNAHVGKMRLHFCRGGFTIYPAHAFCIFVVCFCHVTMHFSFLSTQLEAHDCEASRTEVRLNELRFVSVNDVCFKLEEGYVHWEFSHAHLTKKERPYCGAGHTGRGAKLQTARPRKKRRHHQEKSKVVLMDSCTCTCNACLHISVGGSVFR